MMGRFKHGPAVRVVVLAAAATALVFCNTHACESRAVTRAKAANSPATARTLKKSCSKPWAKNGKDCRAKSPKSKSAAVTPSGKAKRDKTVVIVSPSSPAGPSDAAAATPAVTTAQSGMVVGIDPETGMLGMPTPDQMRSLFPLGVSAINHSDAGLTLLSGPGGAVGVDLQGRFQEFYVVRIGPGGRQIVTCHNDPAAIKNALAPPPVATAPTAPPAPLEEQ